MNKANANSQIWRRNQWLPAGAAGSMKVGERGYKQKHWEQSGLKDSLYSPGNVAVFSNTYKWKVTFKNCIKIH